MNVEPASPTKYLCVGCDFIDEDYKLANKHEEEPPDNFVIHKVYADYVLRFNPSYWEQ